MPFIIPSTQKLKEQLDRNSELLDEHGNRIGTVEQGLAEQRNRIGEVETGLSDLGTQVDQHGNRIGTVEQGLAEQGNRIGEVEQGLEELGNRVEVVEQDLVTHGTRLETVENEIDTLGDRIDSIEQELTNHGNRIGAVEQGLAEQGNRIGTVEQGLGDLGNRVEVVEQDLVVHGNRIGTVEQSLAEHGNRIGTVEQGLAEQGNILDGVQTDLGEQRNILEGVQTEIGEQRNILDGVSNRVDQTEQIVSQYDRIIHRVRQETGRAQTETATWVNRIVKNFTFLSELSGSEVLSVCTDHVFLYVMLRESSSLSKLLVMELDSLGNGLYTVSELETGPFPPTNRRDRLYYKDGFLFYVRSSNFVDVHIYDARDPYNIIELDEVPRFSHTVTDSGTYVDQRNTMTGDYIVSVYGRGSLGDVRVIDASDPFNLVEITTPGMRYTWKADTLYTHAPMDLLANGDTVYVITRGGQAAFGTFQISADPSNPVTPLGVSNWNTWPKDRDDASVGEFPKNSASLVQVGSRVLAIGDYPDYNQGSNYRYKYAALSFDVSNPRNPRIPTSGDINIFRGLGMSEYTGLSYVRRIDKIAGAIFTHANTDRGDAILIDQNNPSTIIASTVAPLDLAPEGTLYNTHFIAYRGRMVSFGRLNNQAYTIVY